MNMKTIASIAAVVAGIGGISFLVAVQRIGGGGAIVSTAAAVKQDLAVKITASGTSEPDEIVDVGVQIAGKITAFESEPGSQKSIDYGSPVEPNTVLARIDDSLYAAEVQLARSAFHQAEHQQQTAESGVT